MPEIATSRRAILIDAWLIIRRHVFCMENVLAGLTAAPLWRMLFCGVRFRFLSLISCLIAKIPMRGNSHSTVTSRDSILLRLLSTPWRILSLVLIVVFAVEAVVMLFLPTLFPPELPKVWEAIIDAALLTAISAPILWLIIISPLRRIALEAQALSSTIVENAGDGIITVDSAGKVLSYNPGAQELFGHETERILGQPAADLLPDISLNATGAGEPETSVGRRKGGEEFPASVSIRRLGNEQQSEAVLVVRDLTEAHRAEGERAAAIREKEALQTQQMAILAQLATGVAHEIRNPLTAIKMLVQSTTSVNEMTTLPTEDLKIVEDQIRRMEQSVNALLDYARPARTERNRVLVGELIPGAVRLLAGQALNQSVELQIDNPTTDVALDADQLQLQQLLLNLGLNALSFMPDGGRLSFAVTVTKHQVCFRVADTGPGIPVAILDEIFKPFFTTRKQGIGLGLNICRRIAEEHGGYLTAYNRAAGGATFELYLPSATMAEVSGIF